MRYYEINFVIKIRIKLTVTITNFADKNECDAKPCDHICENEIGSYECSCEPGYKANGDKCEGNFS